MRVRRTTRLAAAILAVALLTAPAGAAAATGLRIGIQDDWAFTTTAANANRAFAAMRKLHAGALRLFVPWADIPGSHPYSRRAPRSPHYNFHGYDGAITRALAQHVQVLLTLTGPAPAWATADHRKGPDAPNARNFGEYVRQAAQWFGDRVQLYSVWNEPNWRGWLSPQRRAATIYRSLYQQAWKNIKQVSPQAKVLIGETAPIAEPRLSIAPLSFLKAVLCNGRCHLETDGYAHHPYDYSYPPTYRHPGANNVTIATLGRLSRALSQWARRGALRTPAGGTPDMYLTEFGYLSSGHKRISLARHASWLVQAYRIALRTPGVRWLVQYGLVPPRRQYTFFDMSIMTARWRPLRPYNALAAWASTMARRHQITVAGP